MFFYRELPPTDPFEGATKFSDDFTTGFDTISSWDTYEATFYNSTNFTVIDQTSLSNPLPGISKALMISSYDPRYGLGVNARVKNTIQSGAFYNYANTKALSIRAFIRYNPGRYWYSIPFNMRLGIGLKTQFNTKGYSISAGNGNPASWNGPPSPEWEGIALSSQQGYGPPPDLDIEHLIPTTKDTWYGIRIDLEKIDGSSDSVKLYTRLLPTDPWTLISTHTFGYGYIPWNEFSSQGVGFHAISGGYLDWQTIPVVAYLANFEVYVKNAPI